MSQRSILVTGAGRGIGRACALQLAKDGFNIIVHYNSSEENALKLCHEIQSLGCSARTVTFDVADHDKTRAAIEADIENNGAYWGIVCNAGIAKDNAFPALTRDDWFRVIDVDLNGFFNVVQPAVMPMIHLRDGGRIVAISSVSGLIGNRGQTNYSAAKAGLIGATKALAVELASRKITVNCVAPGLIDTEMLHMSEDAIQQAMNMIPMRRMGSVAEVANVVSFLMSEKASYVTRQVISVNGGMI